METSEILFPDDKTVAFSKLTLNKTSLVHATGVVNLPLCNRYHGL